MRRFLPQATHAAFLFGVVLATACHADSIVSIGPAQRLEVSVGDRFNVLLRAAALGSYQAPPTISPPIIEFLDVATVNESPPPPGGPLQRFEFRATAPGTVLITFMPTQAGPAASDTVVVR